MKKTDKSFSSVDLYASFEFLGEKLANILENASSISQTFSNDQDAQVFIEPFEKHFLNILSVLENGEYEFYLYSNDSAQSSSLSVPTILGFHQDVEILTKNLVASKDLILELTYLASLKNELFLGFDIIPVTILLYENLHLNYVKILNAVVNFGLKIRQNYYSSRFDRFLELINNTQNLITNEIYFYKIFNKFAYIDSNDVIFNIIKPLSKRFNPFRSSNTLQIPEELNFFLTHFNSLIYSQKIQLRSLVLKFCENAEISEKILEYIIFFGQFYNNQDFSTWSVANLWTAPFVFNDHIVYELSRSHVEIEFCSCGLFFFTVLGCILKITKNFNLNLKNEQSFNYLFRILFYISSYTNELEFGSEADFSFVRSSFTFSTIVCFIVLVYFNILIDKFTLSATQNSKLVSLSVEKILHALLGYGAFVWLRRLISEHSEFLDYEICILIHELIVQFIIAFQTCISSWFRQLNEPRYEENFVYIKHFMLLISDFYGNSNVRKIFGDKNPLKVYFTCFDFQKMVIILPNQESKNYIMSVSLLNFILKLFASSIKFEIIESLSFAFYGLSNSKLSSECLSYLLEMYNMKSFLGSLNLNAENECAGYLNWEKMLRLMNDFPVYTNESTFKISNLLFNNSTPFFIAKLISVIFMNFPEVILEICQNQKYDLILNCVKYLISPDNEIIKSSFINLIKEAAICGQISSHIFNLLERFDYSEQQLMVKEAPSFRCDFLRHSRICTLLYSSSNKDSYLSLLSFTQLVNHTLETYLDSKSIFTFKPCKIYKIYVLYIYFDVFININSRIFSSSIVKWKVILNCLSIMVKVIKYFSSQIENIKKSPVSSDLVPLKPISLQDMLLSFAIEFCKDIYQNDSSTHVFLEVIRKGISLLTSIHVSPKLVTIISKALDKSFEILIEMINLENPMLTSGSGLMSSSTVYIPISEIISNSKISDNKPILFDLLNIFLVTQICSQTIDTFSKIFCLCIKSEDFQKKIYNLFQNQTKVSQKIIHQFSGSWDHQVGISRSFQNHGRSMADFIINLFKYSHFDIAESFLYGISLKDEKIKNSESLLNFFQTRYYLCFPAIMRSLYMSELVYETTELVIIHERLFCILASSLSYKPHRIHLINLIRSFNNCDLVFYILTVFNNRLNEVRSIINPDSNKHVDYFLRLFGSIINITSIDLYQAFNEKNFTRVDKLLELLILKTKNETSFIVHLTKYAISINIETTYLEFNHDSCFSVQILKSIVDKHIEDCQPFPKSIFDTSLKLINVENALRDLDLFYLLECNQNIDKNKFRRDRNKVIEYLNNKNRYFSLIFAKRYIIDSINFCLSCMLFTQSNLLKMLYNSDQELLDIIKQVIDCTFVSSNPDNHSIISFQFSIMNTILCLTGVESFLSACFKKMSVLCLPQNLIVIINHLINYRSSKDLEIFSDQEFLAKYYSTFIYIKNICDKMTKYWYLKNNYDSSSERISPYLDVKRHLFVKISHDSFFQILLNDSLTENLKSQVSCIELIVYLIENNVIISGITIIEYLLHIDFYKKLLDYLAKNSQDFVSFINGNSKINQHQVRLLELIMSCFLLILKEKGGIKIIYVSNFISKLNDSNIIECLISLVNNPFKSNIEDFNAVEEAFQRIYCISIEIISICLNVFTLLRKNIIISISKLFTKNIYAFKSILEYSVMMNAKISVMENKKYSYSKNFINILLSTLKFTTSLACLRNRILSHDINTLLPYNTNIDPHVFDGINNLFECYVGLLKLFSDNQFINSVSEFYLNELLATPNVSDSLTQSKTASKKFDYPPFSFKSIRTIQNIGKILFQLIKFFQSFIYIDSISHHPKISEIIFFPENFIVNAANSKILTEIYSFFKFDSTKTFNKPGINQLYNTLNIVINWKKSINNSIMLTQRCLNSVDYSVELSSLSSFHSKWFDFVQDLPLDKQKEFCIRRLKRIREKYAICSNFLYELIERTLFIIAIHAMFFEDRFFTKVSQHKITQIVKNNRVSEILNDLLSKDQHSKIISQFILSIKEYFDKDKCAIIKETVIENQENISGLAQNLIKYFEEYFFEL